MSVVKTAEMPKSNEKINVLLIKVFNLTDDYLHDSTRLEKNDLLHMYCSQMEMEAW